MKFHFKVLSKRIMRKKLSVLIILLFYLVTVLAKIPQANNVEVIKKSVNNVRPEDTNKTTESARSKDTTKEPSHHLLESCSEEKSEEIGNRQFIHFFYCSYLNFCFNSNREENDKTSDIRIMQ